MQEEALSSLLIRGKGAARRLHRGAHLRPHPALLRQRQVRDHQCGARCQAGASLSDQVDGGFRYAKVSRAFPSALPFRPSRVTPVPSVRGVQTAVVVGPSGRGNLRR